VEGNLSRQTPSVQCRLLTVDEKKLNRTAQKLLAIFEDHAKDLPSAEKDAKWRAFSRVVAKVGTPAKPQARPKNAATPRVSRRHA
jgi:hypothetical protein